MNRIGKSHKYVLAGEAALEQVRAELAPTCRPNRPCAVNEVCSFAYNEPAEQRTQDGPPSPPSLSKNEENVLQEVRVAPRYSLFNRIRHLIERYWLNEVGSCMVAFGALIAIVSLLHNHDGQPLPEWRYGITLNALVSILSTILKAAAVFPLAVGISQAKWLWYVDSRPLKDIESFDDASRGPWGSLLLLLDLRSHYIASFGAFLTVIALAVDPFTQQVMQTQDCIRANTSTVARIPRANIYDINGQKSAGVAGEFAIHLPMAASIYNGLISPPENVSAILTPICPSGNCTFSESEGGGSYQSLAMCHRCENITHLVRNRTSGTFSWSFTLPSGSYLESSRALSATTQNSTPKADYRDFNIEMVMYTNQGGPVAFSQQPGNVPVHLLGARCSLFPCVKTYSAQISHNVLQERELSSMVIPRNGIGMFTLVSDQATISGTARNCATGNDILSQRDGGATEWPAEDCTWTLTKGPEGAIGRLLDDVFDGKTLHWTMSPLTAPLGEPWLRNIYHDGTANIDTISQFMGGLANSITGQIRAEGRNGSQGWAEGAVMVDRLCVRINWPWLAFPAALLVMVVIFIVLTVVATLRTNWKEYGLESEAATRISFLKSSPLALLFFSLQRDVLDNAGHPSTVSQMQDIAQETQVTLKWSWYEDQWRFVKAKGRHDSR